MAEPITPAEALEQAILSPKSVSDDQGRSIVNHPLSDLQDLIDRKSPAANMPHFGIRYTKLIPPRGG